MDKYLRKLLTNQNGVSMMEYLFIMFLIGTVIAVIGPWFRFWLMGTPDNPGFASTVIHRQMSGVNQSVNDKKIKVIKGCASSISVEKCNALN